jgi:hypothetical protein
MYIIVDKSTQESYIIKEKTTVSSLIDKSVSTIYRNQSLKWWETDKYLIYNPQKVLIKSQRGGKNNFGSSKHEF